MAFECVQIGPHVLYRGDCLEILLTLEAGSVDAVVTDPPYGTKVQGWDESIDQRIFAECLRLSRGYCLFFYSNTRLWHILGILHQLGADAWTIVWHKSNAMGFERRFAPQWVPVVCAYRGDLPFWGQDYCHCPIAVQKIDHPTPKPGRVTRWLVEHAVPSCGTILDPFMGSGTTLVACAQTGRRGIGIEIDPGYFAIACRRVEAAVKDQHDSLFPLMAKEPYEPPTLFESVR